MKLSNAFLSIVLTLGIFCWSDLSGQTPAQKTQKTTTKSSIQTFGDGSVHKAQQNSKNTASKKKKKSKPTFGGISDGTSNTIMKTESKPKEKDPKGIKGVSDGTSNTIMINENITKPKEEPKPTKKSVPAKRTTIKDQPAKAVNKKD